MEDRTPQGLRHRRRPWAGSPRLQALQHHTEATITPVQGAPPPPPPPSQPSTLPTWKTELCWLEGSKEHWEATVALDLHRPSKSGRQEMQAMSSVLPQLAHLPLKVLPQIWQK